MRFEALELSLDAIRNLRQPVRIITSRDPKLADQLRRAASSVSLNLSEGSRRVGRDRTHLWRIAAGSADEAVTALRVAEAWGYIPHEETRTALSNLNRVLAILWSLTR